MAFMEGYTTHLAQVAEISIEHGELKVHKIICVVDCGQMVNPRIVESQIESGIVFGLRPRYGAKSRSRAAGCSRPISTIIGCCATTRLPELEVQLVDSDEAAGRHRRGRRALGGARNLQCHLHGDRTPPAGVAHRQAEIAQGLNSTIERKRLLQESKLNSTEIPNCTSSRAMPTGNVKSAADSRSMTKMRATSPPSA